ncbi:MAG: dTDP-4-dehydrorhamnose 3,5-epimerase [Oscillospiraceae bacterium]|jgi:dTDP-4-dehydrorhamnose 3,5-epimerase|nr:dTDP-4-dehydrorhamnose 3,5-epimerase [Oscillospiraceae bacterium]
MTKFSFQPTTIKNLIVITPFCAPDDRGYLSKPFEKSIFAEHGIALSPWEELRSFSKKGVLRGLHFQRCHSQDKLVQVLHGAVYDVAVDLRKNSSTFGQWEGFYLSAENRQMLYIPKGFAHGFLALEDDTLFSYLCGDRYDSPSDGGILWSDPQLAVRWPTERVEKVILSDKDAALPTLSEFMSQYGGLPDTEEKV